MTMLLQNLKIKNMITINQIKKSMTRVLIYSLFITGLFTTQFVNAQTVTPQLKPSWWFGVMGGANFNFHEGSTQKINDNLTALAAFQKGMGIGLFVGPTIEYYKPGTRLGFMFQAAYDNKNGKFKEILSACNCPMDLKSNLSYVSIEPSLRFAPFRNSLYLFAGPRFSFNMNKSFEFQQKTNPAFPDQIQNPEITGDMSDVKKTTISMQVGLGVDIPISSQEKRTQFVLSPFIAYQPYIGQTPRTIETWNITTLRAGAAFKFGVAKKPSTEPENKKKNGEPIIVVPVIPTVNFMVNAPKNITKERTVKETFPLRNYVFFNLGSTEIPNRYVLLKKEQVAEFKEEQVELFTPLNMSGRSSRQMIVYYNILNILGDRMVKNPNSTIKLVGSSESGNADALLMSESVKKYLVDVFGIAPPRIVTEGRSEPKIPSRVTGGTLELTLLNEGDRRVSIESTSPAILMEFQSGPTAPLKPIEISTVQEAPLESYVSFNNVGSNLIFNSWRMEIKDDNGMIQNYGPYSQELITIPGKTIMGSRPEGVYNVKMIGTTPSGETITKDTSVKMVLWTPSINDIASRFSIIYEFNESKANAMSEKYLSEIVFKKIPQGGSVIIHGYTDIIGDAAYNQKLSLERANDVKRILQNALAKAGRSDVKFEVYGFGEDSDYALFNNQFPEERFYNRAVMIDILPAK
jgi:outer membrane protein OmpA-like peptidoglycan-associated protein